MCYFDRKITALVVVKSSVLEVFVGYTKEANIHAEGAGGKVFCEVGGGLIRCIKGVDDFCTQKLSGYQSNTRSPKGGSTSNINRSFPNSEDIEQ